jgi:Kdo2-lipid IVA lauroyltransferase/acyltransferase
MLAYLEFFATRSFVGLFRFVPYGLLYRLSNGIAFLFHAFGYRKQVVMGNLERCFPEKTPAERAAIGKASYRNLADIIVESLKGSTTPLTELRNRYTYLNYEVMNRYLEAGQSVVLVGGHYNNWEWGVITIAGGLRGSTIGVYKPLNNPHTDRWFFNNRSRDGHMILKSMKDTFASVEEYRGQPTTFILIADQIPSNRKTAIAAHFFGQRTACLPGAEQIAVQNNYPVLMYEIERVGRGRYELTFSEICTEPATTAHGKVTQLICTAIEGTIRKAPENWIWSHRRWKWQPE